MKHFATKDDDWLVRLAMVKSGVRAMDAIQEFLASPAGGSTKVDQFVVAGGSKRGWTTWLVGAVDSRVIAHHADGDRRAEQRSDHARTISKRTGSFRRRSRTT